MRLPAIRAGHELQLLEGSREYFPAVIAAVDAAHTSVWLETYIFDFSGGSVELAYALERAARRGVDVRVVVDGVGCPHVPPSWALRLEMAGVRWRTYAPLGRLGLLWPGQWRRLHRKLCMVDGAVGFCGGINVLDDFHDPNHGALEAPRFDFAVRVSGPLVAQMQQTMDQLWRRFDRAPRLRMEVLRGALWPMRATGTRAARAALPAASHGQPDARAVLLVRDNVRHRSDIERAYRRAIGRARQEVVIANAYFVPGRRLRKALVQAARRGVRVVLLLQGRYEYFMQYYAARPVLGALLRAGVEIHEYSPSFLHAKVAVIDGSWATVGSSNLDPLSLLLAREANVVVDDPMFAARLRARLGDAMANEGRQLELAEYASRSRATRLKEWLALVVMRVALAIQGRKYL